MDINGHYRIRSRSAGRYLDVAFQSRSDGARVHVWTLHAGRSAVWHFGPDEAGGHRIRNSNAKKYLDIRNGSSSDGGSAHLWGRASTSSQHWSLIPSVNGSVLIQNRNSGKVLDLQNQRTGNGASVHQWARHDIPSQQWYLERTPSATLDGGSRLSFSIEVHNLEALAKKHAGGLAAIGVKFAPHIRWLSDKIEDQLCGQIIEVLGGAGVAADVQAEKSGRRIVVTLPHPEGSLQRILEREIGADATVDFISHGDGSS